MALERRYRLLPYFYTKFYDAHKTGIPVMQPLFFTDVKDLRLRTEQQSFLLGEDIMVIPAFAENPVMPYGIWETISLVDGDNSDKYQAKLKIRGGSIVPAGRVIQNTNENSFEPLTLLVCLDKDGKAEGRLYWDAGDGWEFRCCDYSLLTFKAERKGNQVKVTLADKEGKRKIDKEIKAVNVELMLDGKTYKGEGSLKKGVTVNI